MTGQQERDRGMAIAETYAKPSQKLAVKQAIQRCYQKFNVHVEWTSDEVHEELKAAGVILKNGRLLGPLMKRAQRAGMIEPVVCLLCHRQETRPSIRPERHAGPQYLWRSTSKGYGVKSRHGVYDDVFWDEMDRQIKQSKGE
tara:strand:+ start:22703 stop:23128 length:426 start_codon:yes stop_codon:yes gene_type:complete